VAHITIIDVFGNLTTDLPASELSDDENVTFHLKGHKVEGLVPSYGHSSEGELVALVDSEDYIEIGAVNSSAAAITGAKIGDTVEVILNE
jgi:S-adenosylmethionine hydrolase